MNQQKIKGLLRLDRIAKIQPSDIEFIKEEMRINPAPTAKYLVDALDVYLSSFQPPSIIDIDDIRYLQSVTHMVGLWQETSIDKFFEKIRVRCHLDTQAIFFKNPQIESSGKATNKRQLHIPAERER